jgi:hypothetical protein
MPRAGFEPTTSVFERTKTVRAFERGHSDHQIILGVGYTNKLKFIQVTDLSLGP